MGLDVSHDCYSGGYGQFQYFRRTVAGVVGIPLELMEGFYTRDDWMICVTEKWGKEMMERRLRDLPVAWKAFEHDAICLFLNHSDCEGEIRWQDASAIAERLEEIAPQIVHPDDMRDDWDFKARSLQFAEGLRRAAELREDVRFR